LTQPFLTIAIPSWQRPGALEAQLARVCGAGAREDREVLVGDDGSTGATPQVVAAAAARYSAAVARLRALPWLAWRALVIQPLRRLAVRGRALDRFRAAYAPDGLSPTSPEDREVALLAARCVGCGLCELGCRLPGAAPALAALGLPAAFRLAGRSAAALPLAAGLLAACGRCAGCDRLCPTGVPIGRVVAHLAARAARAAPGGALSGAPPPAAPPDPAMLAG
jgi:hypothetical protein